MSAAVLCALDRGEPAAGASADAVDDAQLMCLVVDVVVAAAAAVCGHAEVAGRMY